MNPNSSSITFPNRRSVIIDYFKEISPVYFLSHFHMDHVVGLRDVQHDCKIYCSGITNQLVQADPSFYNAHRLLVELPVNSAQLVPELPGLRVTLIPAGHCLGSVMFLFEDLTIAFSALHTGDFRIPTSVEALSSVPAFHREGRVIPIDNAVVDTTFFTEHCRQLPTREESMEVILGLVGDWIERWSKRSSAVKTKSRCQGVSLVAKARFSYEYVYQGLAETFDTKVHISEKSLRYYGQLADGLNFYSTSPVDCLVHVDGCGCDSADMLRVCLSTMYFDKMAGFTQPVVWLGERSVRVLFSFHPSMSEVADVLAYLRPRTVRALVIPAGDSGESDGDGDGESRVQARLEVLLARLPSPTHSASSSSALSTAASAASSAFEFYRSDSDVAMATAAKRSHSPAKKSIDGDGDGDGDVDSDDSLCAMPSSLGGKFARIT